MNAQEFRTKLGKIPVDKYTKHPDPAKVHALCMEAIDAISKNGDPISRKLALEIIKIQMRLGQ